MATDKYAVMAETHAGKTIMLERYQTKDDAEEHPVKLSNYRRVWIEPIRDRPTDLRLPWSFDRHHRHHSYLKDATGVSIVCVLGTRERRINAVAEILRVFGAAKSMK